MTGFDIATWFGFMAPAGTPKEIIDKIYLDSAKILATPEMKKQWLDMGPEPVGSTPAEMSAQIKSEMEKFGALATQAKLSLD